MTPSIRYRGKKWGMVHADGSVVVDYVYDDIRAISDEMYQVHQKGKYGLIHKIGNVIVPMIYDGMAVINDKLIKVCQCDDDKYPCSWHNQKCGVIDYQGNIVLPIIYDGIYAHFYDEGRYPHIAIKKDGKYGLIDEYGNIIIPPLYDDVTDYSKECNLIRVTTDNPHGWYGEGFSGLVDLNHRVVIDINYKTIYPASHHQGYFIASIQKDKVGMIDIQQNTVIGFDYQSLGFCQGHHHLLQVKYQDRFALMHFDKTAPLSQRLIPITEFIYDKLIQLSDKLFYVKQGDFVGVINQDGRIVVPIEYEFIHRVQFGYTGVARIYRRGLNGMINRDGQICIPPKYQSLFAPSDGLVRVKQGGKFGFVDLSGQMVVPCVYDHAYQCKEGKMAVRLGGRWGFLDKAGQLVIGFGYDEVESFHRGVASVIEDGQRRFIDGCGKNICQAHYRTLRQR